MLSLPATIPETVNTLHLSERHRALCPSASGKRWTVLEVHAKRLAEGSEEWNWEVEAFEVSAWQGKVAAEAVRDRLEREGRWLAEASRERMRAGETLSLGELQWQS